MLFSMIVPIYNAEAYLRRCLDSLIREDMLDQYEILLVDDGSTDQSASVCKEYVGKFCNIRYFYKENGGCASARNFALRKAQGKYLVFVDADDYITSEFFQCVLKAEQLDSDFYIYDYILKRNSSSEDEVVKTILPYGKVTDSQVIYEYLASLTHNELWSNIYRSSLVFEHQLRFSEEMVSSSDLEFFVRYVRYVKTAYVSDQVWYVHVFNKDGIVGKNKLVYLQDWELVYRELYEFAQQVELSQQSRYHINQTFLKNSFRVVSANIGSNDLADYLDYKMFEKILAQKYRGLRSNAEKLCLKHEMFFMMKLLNRARILYQRYTKRTWE